MTAMEDQQYLYDVSVNENISLIGRTNRTIFDFNNSKRSHFRFFFINRKEVKLENIIFENYSSTTVDSVVYVSSRTYDFYIEFNNCTFRNSNNIRINFRIEACNNRKKSIQVLFNGCTFK